MSNWLLFIYWLLGIIQLSGVQLIGALYENPRRLEENVPIEKKLPIVFVYSVVGEACEYGLPTYIITSLKQAITFQSSHSDIILASNFDECKKIFTSVSSIAGLKLVDVNKIKTEDTSLFFNYSERLFNHSYNSALWVTSALRFFNLLDIMNEYNYDEIFHVEADNMLYGDLSTVIPALREGYPLAATPLSANTAYVTASVFWANSRPALQHFTEFLLNITINRDHLYNQYLGWLRRYACCKVGGIDPDATGKGIKPYAINEMSILAYYRRLYPQLLRMLPVLPPAKRYDQRRHFVRPSDWMAGGEAVGIATGQGVWDSNSWGQHLGGTHKKKGRDKGFIDNSHIVGQTILSNPCRIEMRCDNATTDSVWHHVNESMLGQKEAAIWLVSDISGNRRRVQGQVFTAETLLDSNDPKEVEERPPRQCFTAPFVRCAGPIVTETEDGKKIETRQEEKSIGWTLLWNLHVHSKQTELYQSQPCPCDAAIE